MFPIRRAALRLLSTSSIASVARPRTVATFSPASLRLSKPSSSIVSFQRRWASNEAEAKKEEVPISQLQPTAQEEVENAISEDNSTSATTTTTTSNAQPSNNAPAADFQAAAVGESTGEPHIQDAASAEKSIESQSPNRSSSSIPEANEGTSARAPESASVDSAIDSASSYRGPRSSGRTQVSAEAAASPKKTVYIGNLFFDVTENDLSKEFARFGTVEQVRLIRDARGLSKGFGYVTYETIDSASQAIAELNQQLFEGRRLLVQYATMDRQPSRRNGTRDNAPDKPVNPPSKTLFIGNMSFEMTDRDLNNLFRGIRNVIDVRVAIDRRTGQPRGFAHADFVDVKSAVEAFKLLQGKETYGRVLRLDYSYGPSTAPRNQENK